MAKFKSKTRQAGTRDSKPANTAVPTAPAALKINDACSYLGGIHRLTLYRLVERGLIRPSRGLRHLVFPVVELDRYLRESMEINPRPRKQQAL
jgi:hypothetical protein